MGDSFAGKWNFEVRYKNINNYGETKLKYEGNVTNSKNELMFFYGFTDFVNATVNSEGVLHNPKGKLIGVIEPETCILDFNKDNYNIKIEGFKKVEPKNWTLHRID